MDAEQKEKNNDIKIVQAESETLALVTTETPQTEPNENIEIEPPWRNMVSQESELSKEAGLDDRYEVICRLGEGGMGNVYKVMDKMLDKVFAIKILRSDLAKDRNVVSRFKQEALAASRLTHVNLASVYSSGESKSGAPYLVMDFLEGESLDETLKKSGHLEPAKAISIFIEICDALEHAHAKGVIHRDLKPGNIILIDNDRVKIVDFGIAKVLPKPGAETLKLTFGEEVLGSPIYMSPEQCRGDQLDVRSDIYSFGCMMYEVVCGSPPFLGDNPIKTILKHLNETPANLTLRLKEAQLPQGLEYVILKCLQKDPDDRYQTVFDLRMDLTGIKENKPPKQKTFNRKLRWVGPACTALLIGAVFLLGFEVVSSNLNPDGTRKPLDFPDFNIVFPTTSTTAPAIVANSPEDDEKIAQLNDRIEEVARQFPREDKELAAAEFDLTTYLIRKNDLANAELHCRRIMDILDGINDDLLASRYEYTMGYLLERERRFPDAIRYYTNSMSSLAQAIGDDHPLLGVAHNRMAIAYERNRRNELAESHYQQALEIFKNRYGENSNEVAVVLENLAEYYKHRRMPELEQSYLDRLTLIKHKPTQHYRVDRRDNPYYATIEYEKSFNGQYNAQSK